MDHPRNHDMLTTIAAIDHVIFHGKATQTRLNVLPKSPCLGMLSKQREHIRNRFNHAACNLHTRRPLGKLDVSLLFVEPLFQLRLFQFSHVGGLGDQIGLGLLLCARVETELAASDRTTARALVVQLGILVREANVATQSELAREYSRVCALENSG